MIREEGNVVTAPTSTAAERALDLPEPLPPTRRVWTILLSLGPVPIAFAVCFLLTSPMVLTGRSFWNDWTNSLWILNSAPRLGGLFIHNDTLGIFYPLYAFYGGPLYEVANLASRVVGGHPIVVYIAVWFLAMMLAYCSVFGIARRLGLSLVVAHIPAIAMVTAPYYLTNLYGRGAFSEFVATSAIPLVVLATFVLIVDIDPPRWAWPGLVLGVCVMTGSHVITAVLGSLFLALLVIGLALTSYTRVPAPPLLRKRAASAMAAAGLGLALNAWYLVPDLRYGSATGAAYTAVIPSHYGWLSPAMIVLSPFPRVARGVTTPALYLQIPVGLLLLTLAVLWRAWRSRQLSVPGSVVVWLLTVFVGLMVLISTGSLWQLVPAADPVQYPYRLLSYADFTLIALMMVALRCLADARRQVRRLAMSMFIALVALSIGTATWQVWSAPTVAGRSRSLGLVASSTVPRSWYDPGLYHNVTLPRMEADPARRLYITPDTIRGQDYAADVDLPPGTGPIETNIGADPRLLRINGVLVLGRTDNGYLVVRRQSDGDGPVHIRITVSSTGPVAVGRWLTLAAVATLMIASVWSMLRRRRRSRHRQGALALPARPGSGAAVRSADR